MIDDHFKGFKQHREVQKKEKRKGKRKEKLTLYAPVLIQPLTLEKHHSGRFSMHIFREKDRCIDPPLLSTYRVPGT